MSEASALNPDQIQKLQGTRLKEEHPAYSYAAEMDADPGMTKELAAEIEDYSKRRYDVNPSNQAQEILAEQKEINAGISQEYQWLKPEEYKDEAERKGRIIHSSEFISRLRKADIRCWYTGHALPGRATLKVQREGLDPEVGCWVQLGFMPELSIMRFNEHGVPLDEKFRGWRTCLLQLILKGIIKEDDAKRHFGKPKVTPAFARYNSTLQAFRNNGNRLNMEN
jgi:hypothetical protein